MKVDNYASFLISMRVSRADFYIERNKIFTIFLKEVKKLLEMRGNNPLQICPIINEVNNKFNAFSRILNGAGMITFLDGSHYDEQLPHNFFLTLLKSEMPNTFDIYEHYNTQYKNVKYEEPEPREKPSRLYLFLTRIFTRKKKK